MLHQGKIFENILRENKITQTEAAKLFDVSRSTIQNWIKEDSLKQETINKVSELFKVSKDIFEQDETTTLRKKYIETMEELIAAQRKIITLEEKINSIYEKNPKN